jgi:hypothetical protein
MHEWFTGATINSIVIDLVFPAFNSWAESSLHIDVNNLYNTGVSALELDWF